MQDMTTRYGYWSRAVLAWTLVAGGALGCSADSVTSPPPPPEPGPIPTQGLSFLRQGGTAPALTTTDTSFIVTKGVETEINIRYAPRLGETVGEEFLELEFEEESLFRYPPSHPRAGQLFQDGDTVTVRVRIDPTNLIIKLDPSGIQFDPDEPAELELHYGNADEDYDDDGTPDPPETEAQIDLWRQENVGDPWFRIGEIKDADLDHVSARLTSFSRYALAI